MPKYLKVCDRLGNEIRPGHVYHFRPIDAPVTVKDVISEGVVDEKAPGKIVIEIVIPFFREDARQERVAFAELMRIVTPGEEAQVQSHVAASTVGSDGLPRPSLIGEISKIVKRR